jgi:hypothetical protein
MCSVQLGTLWILIAMLGFASTGLLAQPVSAFCENGCSFDTAKDGTTVWKDNNIASSKAESAAVANSQNTVKCFAFCIGSSTANAGSTASSNVKSPTSTAIVTDKPKIHIISENRPLVDHITGVGTECIDNTGSAQDSGYAQGYVDGNRDSVGLNGHGFDDSLNGKHTQDFRSGYHDGYEAGFSDGKSGINKNPC